MNRYSDIVVKKKHNQRGQPSKETARDRETPRPGESKVRLLFVGNENDDRVRIDEVQYQRHRQVCLCWVGG